jgi:hypothetical protein
VNVNAAKKTAPGIPQAARVINAPNADRGRDHSIQNVGRSLTRGTVQKCCARGLAISGQRRTSIAGRHK